MRMGAGVGTNLVSEEERRFGERGRHETISSKAAVCQEVLTKSKVLEGLAIEAVAVAIERACLVGGPIEVYLEDRLRVSNNTVRVTHNKDVESV